MAQCPQCHSEVKPDERFCGNCGARLEPSTPSLPASAGSTPPQPTGKETIVLPKITDLGMQPPTPQPPTDATILAAPAPQVEPPVMPTPQPSETPTYIGGVPGQPPSAPPYGAAGVPAAAPAKSGGNVWKILAIIAGIAVLACVALSVGAYMVIRRAGSVAESTLATANASLSDGAFATVSAGLETAVAEATPEALVTLEPEATPAAAGEAPVLFSDDFTDEQSSSFSAETNESSVYTFVDGGYAITVKKPNLLSWAPVRGSYSDAAVEVETTLDGPEVSAAGLIFHYQDDNNFYMFRVAGDKSYALDMYKDNEQQHLIDWTDEPSIKGPGQVN
ncbi:MAG TPA: zinc-ribbon domain-containing protein, partial [Roseiflexaceae bacterium]|nr:zinc-ribbon domain-containing protein [Roseiflexaceae bacterium]